MPDRQFVGEIQVCGLYATHQGRLLIALREYVFFCNLVKISSAMGEGLYKYSFEVDFG